MSELNRRNVKRRKAAAVVKPPFRGRRHVVVVDPLGAVAGTVKSTLRRTEIYA